MSAERVAEPQIPARGTEHFPAPRDSHRFSHRVRVDPESLVRDRLAGMFDRRHSLLHKIVQHGLVRDFRLSTPPLYPSVLLLMPW
jgi:hypothetical protein